MLGLDVSNRRADANAGVFDEHVEPAIALFVSCHDLLDLALLRERSGHAVDVEAISGKTIDGGLELLRAPGGHRDAIALLAEHPCDRQADTARRSRDDRCTRCHCLSPRWLTDESNHPARTSAGSRRAGSF